MAKKLYILSIGAGGTKYMTTEALEALADCEVIVGYRNYVKELKELIADKPTVISGMVKEKDRAYEAVELAKNGKTTSIVTNGDANVFGTATLIAEIMEEEDLWEEIEVISVAGVTSLLATASRIGAPIGQDFAVISFSNKVTDDEIIDKRVRNVLNADFVLGIYNPKSRKKFSPYLNFLEALSEVEEKIVIIASLIGRPKEKITITTTTDLIEQKLEHPEVTMSTLIIVGNSQTRLMGSGLVFTPRG
jgi:precorrin-3B C17-methyltransferase